MEHVTTLALKEPVQLDADKLEQLYNQLGDKAAEDIVCRTMEELAVRLSQAERLYRAGKVADLRKCARSLGAIATQVGMSTLTCVAHDVVSCIDACDRNALAAVHQRLLRMGETSLTEIWELRDLSL